MYFKLTKKRPEIALPNGEDTDRWVALTPERMEEIVGGHWNWWYSTVSSRRDSRTTLTLAWDRHLDLEEAPRRAVVLRTVNYRYVDLISETEVCRRRRILEAQLDLLNQLGSPLLPEPVDWLEVRNQNDGLPAKCVANEPVLVLDWQLGVSLEYLLWKDSFQHRQPHNARPVANEQRIARIGRGILAYLRVLSEYGVVCFNLNPSHVLLLRDDVPRFLGLGGLCPVLDSGEVDADHPNFLNTTAGYFPPEINNPADDWAAARATTPESVGAFALGVLLLQMACGKPELPKEWLWRGTVSYPDHPRDPEGSAVRIMKDRLRRSDLHELICRLCASRCDDRLTNLDEIDEQLACIAGDVASTIRKRKSET
jgi:serine/threonine protein kinase